MADVARYPMAALVVGLVALLAALPARGEPPPERQRELVHLLRHDCGSCHGLTLRGGLGPPLTAPALANRSAETLEATIAHGMPGTPMPPWRGLLSNAEIGWLVATMQSGLRSSVPTHNAETRP